MSFQGAPVFGGNVSVEDAYAMLEKEPSATLVDVRTQPEWQFVGAPDLSGLSKTPIFLQWQVYPAMDVDSGFVSKLSFLISLLTVAAVILSQAPDTDDDFGPEDPLVWADIERHFERADRKGGPSGGSIPDLETATGDPSSDDVEPPNDAGPGRDKGAASE